MPDESPERYKLLLVDDDREFLEDALSVLQKHFDCVGVAEADDVLEACEREDPDAVLLDLDFHGEPMGFDVLPLIREQFPCVPVVIWTETSDIHAKLRAQDLGAFHFVNKAARPGDMLVVLHAAFKKSRALLNIRGMRAGLDREWGDLIYVSEPMADVVDKSRRAAMAKGTVLLTGETGVGKSVIAYEIHRSGPRSSEQFVHIECAGITEGIADSELFGHEKGSFTNAFRRMDGMCRAANHGTLFLDEVGDMPWGLQSKIRRLVEEKRVRRVGSNDDKLVDMRLIAATNRNLEQDIKEGRFRQDLFYRLNVITINIPPLRERRTDIVPLALHFLGWHRTEDDMPYDLSPDAAVYLESQDWPGNVRELKNAIDRACMLNPGPTITGTDLADGGVGDDELVSYARAKEANQAAFEREYVLRALVKSGSVTKAADLIQVSRDLVYNVIKRRGIRDEEWKPQT
jgi:DNA-binding NtrC family response regulator